MFRRRWLSLFEELLCLVSLYHLTFQSAATQQQRLLISTGSNRIRLCRYNYYCDCLFFALMCLTARWYRQVFSSRFKCDQQRAKRSLKAGRWQVKILLTIISALCGHLWIRAAVAQICFMFFIKMLIKDFGLLFVFFISIFRKLS